VEVDGDNDEPCRLILSIETFLDMTPSQSPSRSPPRKAFAAPASSPLSQVIELDGSIVSPRAMELPWVAGYSPSPQGSEDYGAFVSGIEDLHSKMISEMAALEELVEKSFESESSAPSTPRGVSSVPSSPRGRLPSPRVNLEASAAVRKATAYLHRLQSTQHTTSEGVAAAAAAALVGLKKDEKAPPMPSLVPKLRMAGIAAAANWENAPEERRQQPPAGRRGAEDSGTETDGGEEHDDKGEIFDLEADDIAPAVFRERKVSDGSCTGYNRDRDLSILSHSMMEEAVMKERMTRGQSEEQRASPAASAAATPAAPPGLQVEELHLELCVEKDLLQNRITAWRIKIKFWKQSSRIWLLSVL